MTELKGRRILVTGASGLMAFPVAAELAKDNVVYGVARFSRPEQKDLLEATGVRAIQFDIGDHDLSPLPKSVDVVIHYSTIVSPGRASETPELRERMYDGNVLSHRASRLPLSQLRGFTSPGADLTKPATPPSG